ncbi:hypothetical protein Tco_0392882 [Tanacetum coccineum]
MANLEFCDKHNMVAYLQKSEGSEGFHQIIDFLNTSHIKYALTENPTIYVSFIKQFWRTATASTSADGEVELTGTIDGQVKTITEASLRRHLKLEDNGGVTTLPYSEIFEQLALIGYATDSDKLTFQKGHFSFQWRFLIHTILHYLSPKKTAWEQFSSNIATDIICLATNETYNFSKMIFDAMIKYVDSTHKFLMYPRFIQICLNMQKIHLQPHSITYAAHSLINKVFSNMKRVSRGYSEIDIPLFPTMINLPSSSLSPSKITSSLSLSPQHTPVSTPSTSQPPNTQPTPDTEEAVPMPHKSPLQSVHSLGRDKGSLSLHELTVLCTSLTKKVEGLESELKQTKQTYNAAFIKLIKRVKRLEQTIKTSKARRKAKIVQKDADIQIRTSDDTEVLLEEEEPTELVEDQGSGEKGEKEVTTPVNFQTYIRRRREVSTGSERVSTASRLDSTTNTASEIGSTASEKRKDKGKGIMTEPEPEKKTKLQQRQERASLEAAIRLEEQFNEEERQRIARDAEIAKQLQEEINKAGQERVVAEDDQAHVIDWNDPSVIRYHALQNRPRSVAEVRKNMCTYLKNQGGYKLSDFKGMSYEDIRPIFEKCQFRQTDEEPKTDELSQEQLNQMIIIVPEEGMHSRKSHRGVSGLTKDKEKELWVELKMLFEPDEENLLKLQRYMHDPLKWWLYDTCVVYHVSTERGQNIFMMVEKDYPLTKGLAALMLCNKLRVDQHSEMADELLTKIFNISNRPGAVMKFERIHSREEIEDFIQRNLRFKG